MRNTGSFASLRFRLLFLSSTDFFSLSASVEEVLAKTESNLLVADAVPAAEVPEGAAAALAAAVTPIVGCVLDSLKSVRAGLCCCAGAGVGLGALGNSACFSTELEAAGFACAGADCATGVSGTAGTTGT